MTKIERLTNELVAEVAKARHEVGEANRKKGWKYDLGFELAFILGQIRIIPRMTAKQLAAITGHPIRDVRAALRKTLNSSRVIVKTRYGYQSRI